MSDSWWMWLGVVAVVGAVLAGLHWRLLDLLLDSVGARADSAGDH